MNKNIKKLLALIEANPTFPILPMVDSEVVEDDGGWWAGEWGDATLSKCCTVRERLYFYDKDELSEIDTPLNGIVDKDIIDNWSDEELVKAYNELPWIDVILVHINAMGRPEIEFSIKEKLI